METKNQDIVIYQTNDASPKIAVKLAREDIWLTQRQIEVLFESSKANISEHISHIFKEGELSRKGTVRKFRTVQQEGTRSVSREREFYNLDMIIAVGYRINSKRATQFRIWATNILKQYLTQGYALNEQVLLEQQAKTQTLQQAIGLLSRLSVEKHGDVFSALAVLDRFSKGLTLLDDYDHKQLDEQGQAYKLSSGKKGARLFKYYVIRDGAHLAVEQLDSLVLQTIQNGDYSDILPRTTAQTLPRNEVKRYLEQVVCQKTQGTLPCGDLPQKQAFDAFLEKHIAETVPTGGVRAQVKGGKYRSERYVLYR